MNRELLELKDAIKAYQQELSVEKLRYSEQIESLNDDLQQRVYERDEWCHRVKELESEMAGMIRQKEDELRKVTELGR
jgi:D-ribose pyranose/furanose isomerase RbsD